MTDVSHQHQAYMPIIFNYCIIICMDLVGFSVLGILL
jgi:hypothetical protein